MLALGLPFIGYGLIFNLGFAAVGGVIVVLAGFGWGLEPADDPEAHHGHAAHDDHDHSNGQSNGHEVEGETAAVGAGSATATTEEAGSDD